MTKDQAKKLVKDVFEQPFDKGRFCVFVKNLLNQMDGGKAFSEPLSGPYISEGFRDSVRSLDRAGQYKALNAAGREEIIDILIVHLKKDASLKRARTAQRNYIAKYLKSDRGGQFKDGALAAFVSPDGRDWRFSLIQIDYKFDKTGKVKDVLTPARRYSFLVGESESSRAAQQRFVPFLREDNKNPALKDLEEAFSVEKVTKEFFEQYRRLFLKLKAALDAIIAKDKKIREDFAGKGVKSNDFSKKLLGQIVFLYFLQKKGWFGVRRGEEWGSGSKHFLREELFDRRDEIYSGQGAGSSRNFFNDILEPLFYEALGREHSDDYYSRFDCRMPFLNGGLFEPLRSYDWVNTDILLPDSLFSNTNQTKEGGAGDGILDVFDLYNFTVNEDEPLEKEVAVDPEMLGKVFENLLEIQDRKSRGTYYTPREIVHYMCRESLINYLFSAVSEGPAGASAQKESRKSALQAAVKNGEAKNPASGERQTNPLISKSDIEAFIRLGDSSVEHDTVYQKKAGAGQTGGRYAEARLPDKVREHAVLIDKKLADVRVCDPAVGSGAFPVGMMNEIVRARSALTPFFSSNSPVRACRTPYHFKRHAIERSLYGADIDASAIEIAKLRLWLSLVVDEEDRSRVQPLPNLDFKMICGNSLLGLSKDDGSGTKDAFYEANITELHKKKSLYFNETSPSKKQKYKAEIERLISAICVHSIKGNRGKGEIKKIFDFEIYFSEIFMEKRGFDVVIANPPYVEHKKLKKISGFLKSYKAYSGTADLYVYFYEKGLDILNKKGVLAYISSNKFIKTSYGANLRALLSKLKIHAIIDFSKAHVFDALVSSCILIISKCRPKNDIAFAAPDKTFSGNLSGFVYDNHIKILSSSLNKNIWILKTKAKTDLKNKIERGAEKLGGIAGVNIFRGVTTGYNKAFIIEKEAKEKIIKLNPSGKKIIKPLLQGRNIKKWNYENSRKFLIFTRKGTEIENYPEIEKHLFQFKKSLTPGPGGRSPGSYKWHEIQANTAYWNEFEKPKIIWGLTADKWAFAWDREKYFLPSNGYILTSEKLHLKYILAVMNSNLMEFYFSFIGIMTAGGAFTLKHETVAAFPVKPALDQEQQPLIDRVDKILAIVKTEGYLQNPAKQAKVREYEKQIDQLVYKLYSCAPEEIKIIEKEIK